MKTRKLSAVFGLVVSLVLAAMPLVGCSSNKTKSETAPAAAPKIAHAAPTGTLAVYVQRLELTRKNLQSVLVSSQVAAQRTKQNPLMLVNVPYGLQSSFAEEIVNRAGGLANAFPPEERPKFMTPQDVLLLSVRSWEEDAEKARQMIKLYGSNGSYNIVFGSRAGIPPDIKVDAIIDNGAPTGGKEEGAVNAVMNITNAWVWCLEYTAALTRQGQTPAVLKSIFLPGGMEFDHAIQGYDTRRTMGKATRAVPAGEYAKAYYTRLDVLMDSLTSDKTRGQINAAADLIASHIKAGGTVGVASCTHILLQEIFLSGRTPMKPFNVVWHSSVAFEENLKPGDVMVFFGYMGVKTTMEDYDTPMKAMKLQRVVSFTPDTTNEANNAPDAAVRIEQSWTMPDAEVKLDFEPGFMAPVSGVDQGLLYRMLEDAVAERLK
ncbi:MAG: hypothetical protein K8S99_17245 [Planctomycetes bacterium]|nr:hypothetical protein [Planctomycetota bacterium]